MRAASGATMSTAWTRASGMRMDWRRNTPVSICRSEVPIRQRVTSHDTKPAAMLTPSRIAQTTSDPKNGLPPPWR
jgi:hypothetical protein